VKQKDSDSLFLKTSLVSSTSSTCIKHIKHIKHIKLNNYAIMNMAIKLWLLAIIGVLHTPQIDAMLFKQKDNEILGGDLACFHLHMKQPQ